MRELIKQPNGKFCRMNYYGSTEFCNMTEEDIINMYIKWAKEDIENAKHSGEIINRLVNGNKVVSDETLKIMGFDKSYKELIKYIPQKPLNEVYVPRDFTTYAKCPNCGRDVRDGIGGRNEKCVCGQLLKW